MTPLEFLHQILDPGLELLTGLGGPAVSDAARQFLLCVALQESGPKLEARYQNSPSASAGSARGWWQFEQGGGVRGVMSHPASSALARQLCGACYVQWNEAAIWRALEGHDMLSAGFGRLLLYTDPHPIPTLQHPAWICYADRLWRPGKPHPDVWPGNWSTAHRTISPVA